ncbi:hypothetical protein [Hymenobacter amundsenii]|nr:hypothetical protein [Hymenobacter amundsenii]
MYRYFGDAAFQQRADRWQELVATILPVANYLEVQQLFAAQLPAPLRLAGVPVPERLARVYGATHRFALTPEVAVFCQQRPYSDWQNSAFEDPAFFLNDTLLLGSISHEDAVVLRLSAVERQQLNATGYDFWCEWPLDAQ